jgi:hypothetical protein
MPEHETVKVKLGQRMVDIDVRLAPLIRLLWDRKIRTLSSCQEQYPRRAWIVFPGTSDVKRFLDVAQKDYRVETNVTWFDSQGGQPRSCRIWLHVHLPQTDLPGLVEAFEKYQPAG